MKRGPRGESLISLFFFFLGLRAPGPFCLTSVVRVFLRSPYPSTPPSLFPRPFCDSHHLGDRPDNFASLDKEETWRRPVFSLSFFFSLGSRRRSGPP